MPDSLKVKGTVRTADGKAAAGYIVQAFDQGLRRAEVLDKDKVTTTANDGSYEILYTREQFTRAEKDPAHLMAGAASTTIGSAHNMII